MDQIKIGKFIADRRKAASLTQAQLAEKLNITDRAVSKWERGLAMPDSSIMLELCRLLGITVNDLLSGEVVTMEKYNEEYENKLIELVKEKEESDKRLLRAEIVWGICCMLPFLAASAYVAYTPMDEAVGLIIVLASMIPLIISAPFLFRIEQKAGYYECKNCGHKHIPKYGQVVIAPHVNRTRYMRCPQCKKVSWQKKKISKD